MKYLDPSLATPKQWMKFQHVGICSSQKKPLESEGKLHMHGTGNKTSESEEVKANKSSKIFYYAGLVDKMTKAL